MFAAAAAAKSLQSCPTLCDPIDDSLPGSPVPGILQARILEWVAISFSKVKSESEVTQSCPTPSDPMDCSPPAPLSMGFARQEYWSGVPLPSPQTILQSYSNQNSTELALKQKYRSLEQNRKSRNQPMDL